MQPVVAVGYPVPPADGGDRRRNHRDGDAVRRGPLGGRGAARRLARHLIENGSHGLVLAGTTGESPTLDDAEKLSLLRAVRDELGSEALIICGTGSNDTRHSERLSAAAADAGADAVLAVTPYYNKPNFTGIRAHYEAVAKAAGIPVLLYNIPSRVVVNLPPEQLAELAGIENVVGVKQANDDELQPIEASACWPETTEPSCGRWRWGSRGASWSPPSSWGER